MAVKYESTLSKYKASSDAKTGGVHNEGLFHIWTPDKNKNEYNQLIRQGRKEYGKDFESVEDLRAFAKTFLVGVKTNGSAPTKVTNSIIDEATEDTLYALLANASHDRYRTGKKEKFGDYFDGLHASWVASVRKGIEEFKSFKNLVNKLEAKNLSENQINQFLSSNKINGKNTARLDLIADDVDGYSPEDFANLYGVTNDKDADGNPTGIDIEKAANAQALAKDELELAQQAIDESTFGDATNSQGLTKVPDTDVISEDTTDATDEDAEPQAGDEFTDEEGKTVFLGTDGKYYYEDGTPYISPDQNTVPEEIKSDQASSDAAEEVVDQAVQDVAAGADTAADIQTSVLGGDVSTGVAEQLGWEKGTKEVDGKTVTTFTDPRTNTTYDVDPDTGMLTDTDGNTVSTVGSLNFEENDFAQQFTDAANDFLYGAALTEQAALSLGFTKTGDTYTGPDGQTYTLNGQGQLVDEGNNVARSDGFLDYQTQLQNANAEYTTAMEGPDGLLSKYEQTFSDYQTDFQPRMDQLDSNISALNQVATDAGDRGYYNQLRDVYFADSMDQVNRNTESSRDAINQMYAKSGMDTNSPAYSSAMVDLQNKRSEAARTARRQAILDSYGLGTQMLTNRTNALNSAQTGIRSGMDALSDLYDVKLEGLGVERDMISTIYEGKKEGAKLGMEGLGVTTGLERDKINANQSQYFKDLDVRTGLNNNTVNTNVTAANTANTADVNATDDYWTGMGWLQTLVDNDFDWRAAGAAIQTQFPDFDTSTLDEKLQVKFGFK